MTELPTGTEYDLLLRSLRYHTPWAVAELGTPRPSVTQPPALVNAAPLPPGAPLGDRIRRIAAADPDRVAVSDGVAKLTYAELDERTARLASGATPRDVVAIVLGRGVALIEAMVAVWRAGAAFIVLDPAAPPAWRTRMAAAARANLFVADTADALPGVPELTGTTGHSAALPAPFNDDPAYIIQTSGSTGDPKLVVVHHLGVTSLIDGLAPLVDSMAAAGARVLQYSAPSFDGIIADVALALGHGLRLEVLAPGDTEISPSELLVRRHITHAILPAAVVRTIWPDDVPDLRLLISVGERCLPSTAQLWASRLRFFNGYGPAEAAVCTTLHEVVGSEVPVPIGTALAGRFVVITDENLRAVPNGQTGEICIGGLGVGLGYLGMPEETAAKFIPNRFGSGRLYRTGDVGRIDGDGCVEFVGRRDLQVKIRGVRVELAEVEHHLNMLPGVAEAIAVADPSPSGDLRLLGYIRTGGRTTGDEVLARLAEHVPAHLVPSSVIVVDQWPLSRNGKIDRKSLSRPDFTSSSAYVEPRTRVEKVLCELAADLLQVARVGMDDDFLAMGGHSLLATQFAARIREVLGVAPTPSAVIRARTVAEIAEVLATPAVTGPVRRPRINPRREPSFAQRRVWLLQEMAPDSVAYVAQAVLHFGSGLDIPALEASLTELVRRHEVLRTTFTEEDGEPLAEILPPWHVTLPVDDISGFADIDVALGTLVRDALSTPFRLEQDPVVRWRLIRVGPDEHVLVHIEHHVVHDGWSSNVLLRDLIRGYAQFARSGKIDLPEPELQYYDYSDWQRDWCRTPAAAAERAFWRAELDGAPQVLPLPGRARRGDQRFHGSAPRLEIDATLASALDDLASQVGGTLFMTLLTAFYALLYRYTTASDMLVCSGVANRNWPAMEDMAGMVVNTVVLRCRVPDDRVTFRALLAEVRDTTLRVYDHQELPLEEVVDAVQTDRIEGINPLVQVMFSFHDAPHRDVGEVLVPITVIEALANGTAKFDLNVVATPRYHTDAGIRRLRGNVATVPASADAGPPPPRASLAGVTVQWEYDTDRFDEPFIRGMLEAYLEILRAVVVDADQPLIDLPLLNSQSAHALVTLGRGTEPRSPAYGWLPELIDEWTHLTPNADAVVTDQRRLTYAELGSLSGGFAADLARAGVERGDVVAIGLPPSAELVVALIGVLRAGATIVAFDPLDPPNRTEWLLHDCAARVVVTEVSDTSAPPPPVRGESSDIAYICYTSGSTGVPKGVPITHGAMAHMIANLDGFLAFGPGKRVLQTAPAPFDVAMMEIIGSLAMGAALHVPEPGWNVRELADRIINERITQVWLIAPLLSRFAAEQPDALARVEQVWTGADVVSPEAVRVLLDHGAPEVVNNYGPTEATCFNTFFRARKLDHIGSNLSIGRPAPGVQVYLLDNKMRLVPRGTIGEIWLGGPGISPGYLNRPRETEAVFRPNPFGTGTIYRTGDLARWLADGNIEFLGRRDFQVKIQGRRIELGEVAAAVTALPEVSDALAVAVDDRGDRKLACYVVPARGHSFTDWELLRRLYETAPRHLVPKFVVVLDAWPVNGNGKIDRSKLPPPGHPAPVDVVPPRTTTEQTLVAIAADLLGRSEVGVHDDFFLLGGDSLLAMKFAARVRATTGAEIRLSSILATPTIARLAGQVDAQCARHRPIAARTRTAP